MSSLAMGAKGTTACSAGGRPNNGGLANPMRASRRNTLPDFTRAAASTTPSAVKKFRHPNGSSSPNTPPEPSAGKSFRIGNSSKVGIFISELVYRTKLHACEARPLGEHYLDYDVWFRQKVTFQP